MKKIAIVKWIIDRTDGGLKVAVNLSNELSEIYEVHDYYRTNIFFS